MTAFQLPNICIPTAWWLPDNYNFNIQIQIQISKVLMPNISNLVCWKWKLVVNNQDIFVLFLFFKILPTVAWNFHI